MGGEGALISNRKSVTRYKADFLMFYSAVY